MLRLGTYHDLWADYVAERNPSLEYLSPPQTLELSEGAARGLGVGNGTEVIVTGETGEELRAVVAIRPRMPDDVGFLIEGTAEDAANLLGEARAISVAVAPAAEEDEAPALGVSAREKVAVVAR